MRLPPDLLAEITGHGAFRMEPYPAEGRSADRRRLTLQAPMLQLTPGGLLSGTWSTVRVCNISDIGVSVLQRVGVAPGERILLQLPRRNATPVTLRYLVVRSDSVGDGLFMIGGELEAYVRGDAADPPAKPDASYVRRAVSALRRPPRTR